MLDTQQPCTMAPRDDTSPDQGHGGGPTLRTRLGPSVPAWPGAPDVNGATVVCSVCVASHIYTPMY